MRGGNRDDGSQVNVERKEKREAKRMEKGAGEREKRK